MKWGWQCPTSTNTNKCTEQYCMSYIHVLLHAFMNFFAITTRINKQKKNSIMCK